MENSESSEHNDIFFITESMSRNPIDKVLSAEFLLETFDPVIIKAYVDQFTDPSKMLIVMADSEYTYAKAFESGYKDVTQLAEV
jgi:secreted Zn-dependent insulinase-like peptidase